MAFQAEVLQRVQFAVESTKGTIVTADKRFFALVGDLDARRPTFEAMQAGVKFPVGNLPGKGFEELSLKGPINVQDMIYLLATGVDDPAFSVAGTNAYAAVFAPSSLATNTLKTISVEKGASGSGNADKFAYGALTEFEMDFKPNALASFTGKVIGRQRTTGVTFTSATALDDSLIYPTTIDVFLATSEAGLSSGQVYPLSVKIKMNKALGDVYTLGSSTTSFDELVETAPNLTAELVFPKSSATNGYLGAVGSTLYYLEVRARGSLIENVSSTDYFNELKIRMPIQFTNPGEGADQDVHTATFVGNAVHDPTFNSAAGGALLITAQSELTTL